MLECKDTDIQSGNINTVSEQEIEYEDTELHKHPHGGDRGQIEARNSSNNLDTEPRDVNIHSGQV